MIKKTSPETLFAFTLVASAALGTATYGSPHKGQDMSGDMGHMMQMMGQMHERMHEHGHSGMRERHGMQGNRHGMGGMKKMLDANRDGEVTPEEAAEQLQAKLKQYDADGDGSLSIAEYEALHSAMIREKMVDRFQHLDADGDGQITSEEMDAPARQMKRMRQMKMKMKPMASESQSGMTDMDAEDGSQDN